MRPVPSPLDRRPRWPSGDLVTEGDIDEAPCLPRRDFLLPAVVLGLGMPRMLLTGEYAGLSGTSAWSVLACLAVVTAALPLVADRMPALRRRQDDLARIRSALESHTDPGPGLRERTDVLARRVLRLRWMGTLMPLLPLVLLLQARWERPGALPAAAALVLGYVLLMAWHRRQTRSAERWIADPPGPHPRAVAPVPWWEPWLGGRRLAGLFVAYVLAVAAVVLAARTLWGPDAG